MKTTLGCFSAKFFKMTLNWREEIVRTGKAEIEAKRLVYEILADTAVHYIVEAWTTEMLKTIRTGVWWSTSPESCPSSQDWHTRNLCCITIWLTPMSERFLNVHSKIKCSHHEKRSQRKDRGEGYIEYMKLLLVNFFMELQYGILRAGFLMILKDKIQDENISASDPRLM